MQTKIRFYSNSRMGQMFNAMFASDSDTNNLTKFKAYLEEKMAEEPEKKRQRCIKRSCGNHSVSVRCGTQYLY